MEYRSLAGSVLAGIFCFYSSMAFAQTAPQINSEPVTQAYRGSTYEYQIEAFDAERDALSYHKIEGPKKMSMQGDTLTWNVSKGKPKDYPITVGVSDGINMTYQSYMLRVSDYIDINTPPEIVSEPVLTVTASQSYQYKIIALDEDGDSLVYSLLSGPVGMSLIHNTLEWLPSVEQIGSHDISIAVSDNKSSVRQVFSLTVASPNQAPVITSAPGSVIGFEQDYRYVIHASDPDNDELFYSLITGPSGMFLSGQQLIWKPGESDIGAHEVSIEVSDGELSVQQGFSITVQEEALPSLSIIGEPVQTGIVGETYQYPVQVMNLTTHDSRYWLIESPFGMRVEQGQIVWDKAHVTAGRHYVSLKVSNGESSVEQHFVLTIADINKPPVFTTWPSTIAMEGGIYEYFPEASDPDDDALSYELLRGPEGMTLSGNILYWLPSIFDIGRHSITVSVNDGVNQVEQDFNLTVGAAHSPVIRSKPPTQARQKTLYEYTILAMDPEGDALSYRLIEGPRRMSISANVLSWSVNKSKFASYPVTIEVSDGVNSTRQSFEIVVSDMPELEDPDSLPVITSVPEIDRAISLKTYFYDIQAHGPDGGAVSYSIEAVHPSDLEEMSLIGNRVRFRPLMAPVFTKTSQVSITIAVTDDLGNLLTQDWEMALSHYDVLPRISSQPKQTAHIGHEYLYEQQASATDASIDLTASLTLAPEGMSLTRNGISWTPVEAQQGMNSVELSVENGVHEADTAIQQFNINVSDIANQKPLYDGPGLWSVFNTGVSQSYQHTVLAKDMDGDNLQYYLVEAPMGVELNGNVIAWQPTEDDVGDHYVTVFVSDGRSVYVHEFNWTVNPEVNQQPTLTNTPQGFAIIDQEYQYTMDISDNDGPDFSPSAQLVSGPAGMSQFGQTLYWTPVEGQEGEHTVVLLLDDGYPVEYTFNILVGSAGFPEIESTPPAQAITSLTYEYTIVASDPSGLSLIYSLLEPVPDGMTLDGNTLTWVPLETQAGTYTITVNVSNGVNSSQQQFDLDVVVLYPPVANAGSDQTIDAGGSVALDALGSTDSDGEIVSYEWLEEGELLGTSTSILLENLSIGLHEIQLRVTDNDGLSNIDTVFIMVNSDIAPTISWVSPSDGDTLYTEMDNFLLVDTSDPTTDLIQVEWFVDGVSIGVDSIPPYGLAWSDPALGSYTLTATATNDLGASTTTLPITVSVESNPLQLSITSPLNGETLLDTVAVVKGTFDAPANAGITVNGKVATVSGNQFFVELPVAIGENQIQARLATIDGITLSKSITVSRLGPDPDIQIEVQRAEGLAPFTAQVKVTNGGSDIAYVDWLGIFFEVPSGEAQVLTADVTIPGVYPTTLTVNSLDAGVIRREIVLVAFDEQSLDQKLRVIWADMNSALIAGDKEKALQYLSYGTREKFDDVFDVLIADMPTIQSEFSDLHTADLTHEYGEYGINREIDGETKLFLIYFMKDGDGIWRIKSM